MGFLKGNAMKRALIWDLPVRLFHWLLAVGFIVAAIISLGLGDDSPAFPYHAIIGLGLGLLVVLRLIWGLTGTRYARLSSLAFSPGEFLRYLKQSLVGGAKRYEGHNPGSAYAALAMFVIILGLTITGIMLGQGNEGVKELHELLVYCMIAVIGAHLLGLAIHAIRHRDNAAWSMLHGQKQFEPSMGIRSPQRIAAVGMIAVLGAWMATLVAGYDPVAQTTKIPFLANAIQLGESDEHEENDKSSRHNRDDD